MVSVVINKELRWLKKKKKKNSNICNVLGTSRLNVAGQDTVLDLSGSRLEHASQFTPAVIKKAVTCFQVRVLR